MYWCCSLTRIWTYLGMQGRCSLKCSLKLPQRKCKKFESVLASLLERKKKMYLLSSKIFIYNSNNNTIAPWNCLCNPQRDRMKCMLFLCCILIENVRRGQKMSVCIKNDMALWTLSVAIAASSTRYISKRMVSFSCTLLQLVNERLPINY